MLGRRERSLIGMREMELGLYVKRPVDCWDVLFAKGQSAIFIASVSRLCSFQWGFDCHGGPNEVRRL